MKLSKYYSLLLLTLLLPFAAVQATVVSNFSLEELVGESRLIFQGRVLRHEIQEVQGLVYTQVWFDVEEILKGETVTKQVAFRFLGGNSNNKGVEVSGQYVPSVGQHGVYFINDPFEEQINPLTGWHQGAFLIESRAEGELFLDLSERPDLIIANTLADPLAQKMLQMKFTEDQISARFTDYERFPLQDFIDAVRSMAAE